MELLASASDLANLHRQLFSFAPDEGAAFLAVVPSRGKLLLQAYHVFSRDELDQSQGGVAVLDNIKVRELANLRRRHLALVDVHTHPASGRSVRFSTFDEEELPEFAKYVGFKLPGQPFGALVLSETACSGSVWHDGRRTRLQVRGIGEIAAVPSWARQVENSSLQSTAVSRYDRQIRALGRAGQARLSAMRVGIVGLGGTGSQVAQQLAHLGVEDLILVDDDRVESSNLPRLAGAAWWNAPLRSKKTAVAARAIRRFTRRTRIRRLGSLRSTKSLNQLQGVDMLVGCVDNDGARLIMTELAAANLTPYLDIGVSVEVSQDGLAIGGGVGFYLPGGPCLACMDELDFSAGAPDLEAEAQHGIRLERGYATDRQVEPALMPLNTVLVGAALLEL